MSLPEFARKLWRKLVQVARSIIGVPDYDAYLHHCRTHHPDQPPMDYRAFFRERQDARYRGTGGRCC